MRPYNLLLIIALISYSNCFEFTNLLEVKELRKSSYGNSLVETISLTLQNSGNIEEVEKLLNDLEFKLHEDQRQADKEWEKKKAELEQKIQELKEKIEELRIQIVDAEKRLEELKQLIKKSEENISQYNSQHAENIAALEQLAKNRAADEEEYRRSVQEHDDLLNAIEQVINELTKLAGSISGQAKPDHVEEIEAETRDREALKNQVYTSFLQVTKNEREALAFAQIASKADHNALQKLINLLLDLADATKTSRNADEEHEAKSQAANTQLYATLNEDNKNLVKLLEDQKSNLEKYENEAAQKTQELLDLKAEKDRKEHELQETEQELKDRMKQYEADKAERNNEITVIQRLKKVVETRLNNMSAFLRGRVN
jgi:hypothetical protein